MDKTTIQDYTRCKTEQITANTIITNRDCLIHNIHVAANGADAVVTVYDGVNNKGEVKMVIAVPDGESYSPCLAKPVYCAHGCYITVTNATDLTSVTWQDLPKEIDQ